MSMKALEWAMYDVPAEMTKGSLLRILLALALLDKALLKLFFRQSARRQDPHRALLA